MMVKLLNVALAYLSSACLTFRFEFWSSHIDFEFLDHLCNQSSHPRFILVCAYSPIPSSLHAKHLIYYFAWIIELTFQKLVHIHFLKELFPGFFLFFFFLPGFKLGSHKISPRILYFPFRLYLLYSVEILC